MGEAEGGETDVARAQRRSEAGQGDMLDMEGQGVERRIAAVVGQHAVDRGDVERIGAAPGNIADDHFVQGETVAVLGDDLHFRDLDAFRGHALEQRAGLLARKGAGKQARRLVPGEAAIAQRDGLEGNPPFRAGRQHGLVERDLRANGWSGGEADEEEKGGADEWRHEQLRGRRQRDLNLRQNSGGGLEMP